MAAPRKYDDETRARAVRMYLDHISDGEPKATARRHVGALLDINPATLRNWVEKQEVQGGTRPGHPQADSEELRRLRQENAELRRANQILKTPAAPYGRIYPIAIHDRLSKRTTRGSARNRGAASLVAAPELRAEPLSCCLEPGAARQAHRDAMLAEDLAGHARARANAAAERHTAAQRRLAVWRGAQERLAPQRQRLAELERELAFRQALHRQALALDPPAYVIALLGAYRATAPAAERRRWQYTAQQIDDYRTQHGITETASDRALGERPRDDLLRHRAWTRLHREARELRELAAGSTPRSAA